MVHGVCGLERNILRFAGIKPVREAPLGMVTTVLVQLKRHGGHPDQERDALLADPTPSATDGSMRHSQLDAVISDVGGRSGRAM